MLNSRPEQYKFYNITSQESAHLPQPYRLSLEILILARDNAAHY